MSKKNIAIITAISVIVIIAAVFVINRKSRFFRLIRQQ